MGMLADLASASTCGQSAAACWGVRLACDLKFGSLKPRRYFAPAGIGPPIAALPQIMGTNSMPAGGAAPLFDQLYHHETPGKDAVGASALDGVALAAMPRLQAEMPPSPGGMPESTPVSFPGPVSFPAPSVAPNPLSVGPGPPSATAASPLPASP